MAFSEDMSVFFRADELGVSATVAGTALVGVLAEGYAQSEDVEGYAPELHVATEDLPGGVADGSSVVIGARTFRVRNVRPDETDRVTILQLEYVSG